MAEVVLDRPCVLAVIGELVAAGMAKHVTVNEEREARGLANPRDHALIAGHARGARRSTRTHRRLQGPHALAAARRVVLGHRSGERWPCRPWRAERAVSRFGSRYHPNAGPRARWLASRGVGDQDGRGVPMAPAVFAGSLNELLDFPLGKVLARPNGSVNCYIYCHWGVHSGRYIFHCFPQCWLETVTVLHRSVTVLIDLQTVTEGKERGSTWFKSRVAGEPSRALRQPPGNPAHHPNADERHARGT